MDPDFLWEFTSTSPDATASLARKIAPVLRPGNVLLLKGDIGSGKTHFARALIQARLAATGQVEDVPSPTYTLVQTYNDGKTEIWHADLYRLGDVSELAELGLADAFDSAICLVEWPDLTLGDAPDTALHIQFRPGTDPDTRTLTFTGPRARWAALDPVLRALTVRQSAQ